MVASFETVCVTKKMICRYQIWMDGGETVRVTFSVTRTARKVMASSAKQQSQNLHPTPTTKMARFRSFPLAQAYRSWIFGLLCFFVSLCMIAVADEEGDEEEENYAADSMKEARQLAKPWYMRNIQYGELELPCSPITVVIVFFSIYYLTSSWSGKKVYCEASHILLMDHTEESKKKLEDYKQKIGNDAALFAKCAKKYSACPSKSQGGNLGRFAKNAMAPPFDKVCFDPTTPLETTIGPIHTSFGWHLIYIHERQLSE